MKPAAQRQWVKDLVQVHGTSERRVCGLIGIQRSSYYYRPKPKDDEAIRQRLRDLAFSRPRYGYRRLYILLRRESWQVNHKRVLRIYREEGLSVRSKKRKKRTARLRVVPAPPTRINERWSMDFVADQLATGQRFRALTVIDHFSRECVLIEAGTSLPAAKVTEVLDKMIAQRGQPDVITTDNGTEFTSRHFDSWAHHRGIKLDFIAPGRPVQNCYIESFNGKFRDECLNENWFGSLATAKLAIEKWRLDYNKNRPHSSLDYLAPEQFVERVMGI
jgi:putative transposase